MKIFADKTIKELADELGTSKQAIRKYLAKLPPTLSVTKTGRVHTLNNDVQAFIRSRVTTVTNKQDSNPNNEVAMLKDIVISDLKQDKIDLKNQVAELQKLLDQQQLTLQSNKRIKQLEAQLQIGPEAPGENQPSAEEQTDTDTDPVPDKKWWHFLRRDS